MKRTPTTLDLSAVPETLHPFLLETAVFDSSCSPEARVYFLSRGDGFFLKTAPAGTLKKEAELTAYFHKKGLSAEVLTYITAENDWLLTRRIPGADCTHDIYLADPKYLCDSLSHRLRLLPETDGTDWPINRTADFLQAAAHGKNTGRFDASFYSEDYGEISPQEAFAVVQTYTPFFAADTLLHGDYCLPNILLHNRQFSGFIDLGCAGRGDRHIDLFWGAWSLRFNLKTDRYRQRFFDGYGKQDICLDLLRAVAAAETFG